MSYLFFNVSVHGTWFVCFAGEGARGLIAEFGDTEQKTQVQALTEPSPDALVTGQIHGW